MNSNSSNGKSRSYTLHYPTPALPYALWAASQRVRGGSKSPPYSSPLTKGGLRGVMQSAMLFLQKLFQLNAQGETAAP
jgi:hypothetical protein